MTTITIETWLDSGANNKSTYESSFEVDKEEWESLSEGQKDDYAKDVAWERMDWGMEGAGMKASNFKPQLAIDFTKVKTQPKDVVMSVKLDGIRCVIFDGKAYSRTLKLIPNLHIQEWARQNALALEGLDGELIVGDMYAPDVFTKTTSFVMSIDKVQDFCFYAFDKYSPTSTWEQRFSEVKASVLPSNVVVLPHIPATDSASIDAFEAECLSKGAEGIMRRNPKAKYKTGRSGTINPELQKVKRFSIEEFKVVGYEPLYINENAAVTNELGRTSRSTSKEGLRAVERLGALVLMTNDGTKFTAGSGLNDAARDELWLKRDELIGQMASIKFFAVGDYSVPRFPILRGIRDMIDL